MLGAIPRSPTLVPLENRPVEQRNTKELHELVRRQRLQIQQSQNIIKDEDDTKPAVKRERLDYPKEDVVLSDDASSDVEIVEVVAKKRKIEVVELSDDD